MDKTPVEAIASFLAELETALRAEEKFSTNDRMAIVKAATPPVTAYYLKGN